MIHITDGQTDKILAVITPGMFWRDLHKQSLKDNLETFDFDTFINKPFSEYLAKRNRVIIPGEDGKYIEFIIQNTYKRLDRTLTVYTSSSYIELAKAKVIYPQTLNGITPATVVDFAVEGTEWQRGIIHYTGTRTVDIPEHTNPYSFLKRMASELGLELRFRVEVDGNKVIGRYVDMVERIGDWQGREVEFGKDLVGIERKESSDIVTALVCLGPVKSDGTRLEVFVEDLDALKRWGRNGRHLVETYEPQSTNQDMTESELRSYGETELAKRVNSVVEYTSNIADLENVPGLQNKKIRFGDTIKIKDLGFDPPLYLEARVHIQERSISDKSQKKVTLGDYIEYTEDQVKSIWKSLQAAIAMKISMTEVLEVVYTKTETDGLDTSVYQDSTVYADGVSESAKQEAINTSATDATNKANTAEGNAKSYAEIQAEQARLAAVQAAIADAETKITAAKTDLETSIATKADATWVDGQLVTKVDTSAYTQKITDLETSIATKANAEWVNGQLVSLSNSKVDSSIYTQKITDLESSIATKADAEWVNGQLVSLSGSKVDVTTYNQKVSNLETSIATKVDGTWVNGQIATNIGAINIGGTNLLKNGSQEVTATREFVRYADLSPIIDVYGLIEYTISFDIKSANVSTKNTVQVYLQNGSGSKYGFTKYVPVTTSYVRQSITVTPTLQNGSLTESWLSFFGTYDTGNIPTIKNVKVEKGNKATDWSPAPEDYFTEIAKKADGSTVYTKVEVDNSLAGKVATTTYTTDKNGILTRLDGAESSISQNASEVATKVSNTTYQQDKDALEGDISSLSTRMGSAETAITQNANAIVLKANSTDVYTKTQVDSSLSGKANQTDLNSLTTRVTTAESSLTVQAGQIATKVAQSDYDTYKADVQNSSPVNLIHNTEWKVDSATWTVGTGWVIDSVTKCDTSNSMKINRSGLSADSRTDLYSEYVSCAAGGNFVFSIYAMSDAITGIDGTAPVLYIEFYNSSRAYLSSKTVSIKPTANNAWQRFLVNSTAPANAAYVRLIVLMYRNGKLWVARPMMQYGKVASAFTPHVDELATALGTRISTAETTITQHSGQIALKANSSDVYTKNQVDTNLGTKANQSDLSALTTRVSNAESSLTIQAGEITTKVSQTEYDVDQNGVISRLNSAESRITQTESEIATKVSNTIYQQDKTATDNSLSSLTTRMGSAETTITQNSNSIALKANASDVYTKNQIDTSMSGKASQSDLSALTTRVSTAESSLTVQAGQIATKVAQSTYDAGIADAKDVALSMALGKMINTDPVFKSGQNGINVYNNLANGNVVITRIAKPTDCPTTSGYCLEIKTNGTASPGNGGFGFSTLTRANAILVVKLIAKIPVGSTINWAGNSAGTGAISKWLTSTAGTGNWKEYIFKLTCGATGTFSTVNYFYLTGGTVPLTWNVGYATVFDITDNDYSVSDRLTTAETSITQHSNSIALKANSSDVYTKSQVDTSLGTKANQTDLNSLTTRVSNAEASLTVQSGEIASKVSQTEYDADQSGVISRLNSAESSIVQHSNSIALKANSTDVYTKTQMDSSLGTKASQSDLSALTTRVTTAESSLTVQSGQIATKVSQSDFDNLKIGGRNLIPISWLGIVTNKTADGFTVSTWASTIMSNAQVLQKFEPNTTYTYTVKYTLTAIGTYPVFSKQVGFNLYSSATGSLLIANVSTLTNVGDSIVLTGTFTTPASLGDKTLLFYSERFTDGTNVQIGTVKVEKLKIEKGNRATDWSPAPEDVQGQIDGLGTRISTAETSITQNANAIALKASQSSVDTLTGRMSSAESSLSVQAGQIASKVSKADYDTDQIGVISRLDSAESSISQNASEIATKVSTTTYNNNKTTTDNNISSLTTRMGNAESSITQNANSIALKANSTDVYTKNQMDTSLGAKANQTDLNSLTTRVSTAESSLSVQSGEIAAKVSQTDFDNLTIGSRNILKNTSLKDWANWSSNGTFTKAIVTDANVSGVSIAKLTLTASAQGLYQFPLVNGGILQLNEEYVITYYAKSSIAGKKIFSMIEGNSANKKSVTLTTSYVKYTNVVKGTGAKNAFTLYSDDATSADVYIHSIKLEEGNRATDWTPAPEDAQTQIDGLVNRISTAESAITQNANSIALKASQSSVDSLTGRMSSAESTLSTQAGQIASKVSTTDYTGNTIASLINQTATTIQLSAAKISLDGFVEAKHIKSTGLIGATIKTSTSGARVEVDATGLRQFDASGNVLVNMTNGSFMVKGTIASETIRIGSNIELGDPAVGGIRRVTFNNSASLSAGYDISGAGMHLDCESLTMTPGFFLSPTGDLELSLGNLLIPNDPTFFRAYRTPGVLQPVTANVWTRVQYNVNQYPSTAYNTSMYLYQAPKTGVYLFEIGVFMQNWSSFVELNVNKNEVFLAKLCGPVDAQGAYGSLLVKLNEGDYIDVWVRSGANNNIHDWNENTYFTGKLIS